MTLVANFLINAYPVLIGDLVLSMNQTKENLTPYHVSVSDEHPKGRLMQFSIPTVYDVNNRDFIDKKDWIISDLVQKVVIINSKFAVAWAGSAICARGVIKELLNEGENANISTLQRILDEWRMEKGFELYITGLSVRDITFSSFNYDRFALDSKHGAILPIDNLKTFGSCFIGGSGAGQFYNLVKDMEEHVYKNGSEKVVQAALSSLFLVMHFLGDQMKSGSGLSSLFGGGFEITTYLENKLRKLEDITFHFWSFSKKGEDDYELLPHVALKIAYFEDYLIVRKYLLLQTETGSQSKSEIFIIRPVYRHIDMQEAKRIKTQMPVPEMTSTFNAFYVDFPNKQKGAPGFVTALKASSDPATIPIKYTSKGEYTSKGDEKTNIHIEGKLFKEILEWYEK